ncbi:MAG: hypothetical protein H6739_14385 [Alphaproteobacteria bacterium]|nr:hypothetical protein [Alphaproteobacteria bacterium]
MRHVDPPPRPRGWQTHVLAKGRRWLNESPDHRNAKDAKDLWSGFRDEVITAFNEICCYTVVWVPNGDVEHFIPWAEVRGTRKAHLAYQWLNIRYADGWINRSKGTLRFPDPFVVQDEWFDLKLPSLELEATDKVPPEHMAAVQNLLKRTRNDPRVMRTRRRYFRQYQEGQRPLSLVDEEAPLLGRALRANPDYLLDADRALLSPTPPQPPASTAADHPGSGSPPPG